MIADPREIISSADMAGRLAEMLESGAQGSTPATAAAAAAVAEQRAVAASLRASDAFKEATADSSRQFMRLRPIIQERT